MLRCRPKGMTPCRGRKPEKCGGKRSSVSPLLFPLSSALFFLCFNGHLSSESSGGLQSPTSRQEATPLDRKYKSDERKIVRKGGREPTNRLLLGASRRLSE